MPQAQSTSDPAQTNSAPLSGVEDALKEAGLQADTFTRNAANTLTFGLADNVDAALGATLGMGGSGNWTQRYQSELNQEAQRNVYDSINRGIAKGLGVTAGVGLGMADGAAGAYGWADALPSAVKGDLGETLSAGKSFLDGNPVVQSQVRKQLSRGYTRADFLTSDGTYLESKFGPNASLSNAQTRAQAELGPQYKVDWWGPEHLGYLAGGTAGAAGLLSAMQQNQAPHQVSPQVSGGWWK